MSFVRKRVMVLLLSAISLLSIFCPPSPAAPGVVLVLSGGALRGFAHVGVMKVLMENDIPIAGIVGTSMGSLMGGLAAIGYSPEEIIEVISGFDLATSLAEHSGHIGIHSGVHNNEKVLSGYWLRKTKTGDKDGPLGFFSAAEVFEKLTELAAQVEVIDFMKLPIPFAAVATDIETGEKVVLRSGSVASAMRASMSIPGFFEPWQIGDRLLVDGGLVSNLPVLAAKEIFGEYPIVAVDVTNTPGKRAGVKSIFDVLDRSLTILTHQNVTEEKKYADVLISPEVRDFGIFDESQTEAIIEAGIKAANEKLDSVRSLLTAETVPGEKTVKAKADDIQDAPVKDVVVTGIPPKSSALIRGRYLHWIGKPVDTKSIIEASREIADMRDILTADYHIENEDGMVIYLDVVPLPDVDWGVSGYVTNIDPYRWLYVRGMFRNLFSERDNFYGLFKIGEGWGVDLNYRTAPDPISYWEFKYSVQNWKLAPLNGDRQDWTRQGVGFARSFKVGAFDFGLGYAYEYIDGTNENNGSSGPVLYASSDTLDVPSDPTTGSAFALSAWWSDFDEVMFRADYFRAFKLSQFWRSYIRLGFAEGNLNAMGHGVYLGAAEELYSVAANPIEAERMAWANIVFRRVFGKSVFGSLTGEIFASIGSAWDKSNDRIADPWEAGVSITIPNNIIDTKFAVFYTSEHELRFGFFVGNPIWGHYPLP